MKKGICHMCHKPIKFGKLFCKKCSKIFMKLIISENIISVPVSSLENSTCGEIIVGK